MHRYIEPLFDLALAAALWFMLPVLVRQFSVPDMYNGMILSAGFVALIIGTLFLRQVMVEGSDLEPVKHEIDSNSGCLLLAVLMVLGTYSQAAIACQQFSVSGRTFSLGGADGSLLLAILYLYMMFFVFCIAYLFALYTTPRVRVCLSSAKGIGLRIAGMIGVQLGALMLVAGYIGLTIVFDGDLFGPKTGSMEFGVWMVVCILLMASLAALIWLPTRLIIKAYNPNRLAWVTYIFTALVAGYVATRI